MNDYYEVKFTITPASEDAADLLSADLAEIGYESFVTDADGLTAYIKAEDFDAAATAAAVGDFMLDADIQWDYSLVPGQDWNEEWEKHYFQPIVVGDCVIHSSFHTDIPEKKYDIVIDPKMAFGTGHHATTALIIGRLLDWPLKGKAVIDMGTGTGILAILAAMRGASPITGIEIDRAAYDNAVENIALNNHPEISLIHGDASALAGVASADLLIANINRNIITGDIDRYAAALKPGGEMLLSGFYQADIPVIIEAAKAVGLEKVDETVAPEGWACVKLKKV